jgi:hypothetical protein
MPDGDFLITDSASSPWQSTELAQALEKPSVGLTDVLALLGNDRPHWTLRNKVADWLLEKPMHDLAQVDELCLSLGVKDLTLEGSHYANDPK